MEIISYGNPLFVSSFSKEFFKLWELYRNYPPLTILHLVYGKTTTAYSQSPNEFGGSFSSHNICSKESNGEGS